MEEWLYTIKLNTFVTDTLDQAEIDAACRDIISKVNKLICKIKSDKLVTDYEYITDALETIVEQFNDCTDNENYIQYFNEILNELYEVSETPITLSDGTHKQLLWIEPFVETSYINF